MIEKAYLNLLFCNCQSVINLSTKRIFSKFSCWNVEEKYIEVQVELSENCYCSTNTAIKITKVCKLTYVCLAGKTTSRGFWWNPLQHGTSPHDRTRHSSSNERFLHVSVPVLPQSVQVQIHARASYSHSHGR